MTVNWTIMKDAISEASRALNLADQMANECAKLLVGRLRKVDGHTLKQLKAELQGFDSTGYYGRGWKR